MTGEKKDNEEFSFIKEKIKNKPINRKRLFIKAAGCVSGAIVFGVIASLTMIIVLPKLENTTKDVIKPDKVTIPLDASEVQETTTLENAQDEVKEEEVEEKEPETVIVNNTVDLTADDFKTLYKSLADVATVASRYMVTVTGVINEVDWFEDTLENENQDSGIIFAENGQELLILSTCVNILEAQRITITFCDGKMYDGYIKSYDPNTNVSVIAVPMEELEENTKEAVTIAVLGNSYAVLKGDLVISIGSPLGYTDSVTYGVITSSAKTVSIEDANYKVITTDAIGSDKASGALINMKGEVIGFIKPDFSLDSVVSTITAIAISDLKPLIEKLSNSAELLKLGIKGSEVTTVLAEEHNLPVGLYIKEVTLDSPAMNAGIQSGDVMVGINDSKISSFKELQAKLAEYVEGDQITAVVMRQGKNEYKELTFEVTLTKR